MNKKLNFWILNIFITVATSFFLNSGSFEEHRREISPSKGGIGTLKLSGKNFAGSVERNIVMLAFPLSNPIVDSSGK